jgi:DNA invertase Pin-like site-specific DNA recombinase
MLAIGYIRVSTEDQALGQEAQLAALKAWASREGAELAAVYTDAGVSGAAPLEARPALLEAMVELAEIGAGALVVMRRDRLARDPVVAALIEREAARAGACVVSADGVGVGDSPEAQLMRRIVDAMAEYERALIRARTKAALAAKKAKNQRVGSVPLGFQVAEDGHLEAGGPEAALVARAKTLRASGLSLVKVAEALAAEGFVGRSGRPWNATQVARATK